MMEPENVVLTELPRNLCDADRALFISHQHYRPTSLRVRKSENVFVSYIGYCIDDTGLIEECHHAYPHQYQDYANDAGRYFKNAQDDEHNLIYLDNNNTYVVIHHPWANYYHWMTEAISRLWLVKEMLHDLILIFPDDFHRNNYITESLRPFAFKDIFHVPVGKNLFVKNLIIPQLKPYSEWYDRRILFEQRDLYTRYVDTHMETNHFLGKRLYISRKYAQKRKISNEADLERVLQKFGFTIVYCEEHSFFGQVSIFSKARFLISIHGAGLTNMLFMPPGSTVLELHKRKTNTQDQHSLVYWRLASALDHAYYHLICEPSDPEADFFSADFIVDVTAVERILEDAVPKTPVS